MFSHPHGFYSEPFELTLTSPIEGATIFYTLDGRDPLGDQALEYTEPLSIETTTVIRVAAKYGEDLAVAPLGQTYLFADHVPQQQPPEEYPTQWWIMHETGPYEADFEMDPEITEHFRYSAEFPDTFMALPVLSVVMDPEDLFGPNGLHENSEEHGVAWERATSLEMFSAMNEADDFQINCGIRIQGGSGRRPERSTKKSLRVLFKSEYGPTKLNHPLYPESAVEKFDTLVLRARYNRSFAHYNDSQRGRSQYVRERFAAKTQRDMGQLSPHSRHAHVFLNGLYWGIYLIQERPDHSFQAQHLGGEKADYDSINTGDPTAGNLDAWNQMIALARSGVDTPETYAEIQTLLDVDNFIDYMLLQLFLGNVDWPDRNWYAGRHRSDTGLFRFFNWDAELTIRRTDDDFTDVDEPDSPGELFQALRTNPEFNLRFADHVQQHLFDGGVLTPSSLIESWDSIADEVGPAIYAESARWGDHWRDMRMDPEGELYTYDDHWLDERERITEEYFPVRTGIAIEMFRAVGLYTLVNGPAFSQHGGALSGDVLTMAAPQGEIYYTTDGSDPRLEGGAISSAAVRYTGSISLTSNAVVSARVFVAPGTWSALTRAEFVAQ